MEISQQMDGLLNDAIKKRASDIYFLPLGDVYQIKIRNQQEVVLWDQVRYLTARRLMNYCKYLADMALSEQRRPQLGAMQWHIGDTKYALRLSSVGNFNDDESMVIRIIYSLADIEGTFFNQDQVQLISEASQKRGLMVFSGPTGSGKTTTIYNLVRDLVTDEFVMTIEDPIEIQEAGFLQLQVNHEAGMDYSDLIKVGLRHRPDIFIIGEIRDSVTAEAAVKAALSGHLVYTTVHAQDPLGVIKRLLQLGVSSDFIAQALRVIAYQRLIPTTMGGQRALLMAHDFKELQSKSTYDWGRWQDELEQARRAGLVSKQMVQKYWQG